MLPVTWQDVNSALPWLTGSLWGRDWHFVKIAVPLFILFLPLSLRFCRDLDLLALGDVTSSHARRVGSCTWSAVGRCWLSR